MNSVIRESIERERAAHRELFERAGISGDDIATVSRVLQAISDVDLADLIKAPGFNLLPDGEVGSINADTPEWLHWSETSTLREQIAHVNDTLQDYWWHSLRGGK